MVTSWLSSGHRAVAVAVGLCAVLGASRAQAHVRHSLPVPSNLSIGEQHFDASVPGLRTYLESIRTTNPALYGRLVPEAERLDSRATVGRTALIGGMALGLGLVLTGVFTRQDCASPSVSDPNFDAATATWEACHRDNVDRLQLFTFGGIAAAVTGVLTALVVSPTRQDLFDVVNEHNRASPEALRLQIGYVPGARFPHARLALSF